MLGCGVEWRKEQLKAGRLPGGWRVSGVWARPAAGCEQDKMAGMRWLVQSGKQDGIRVKADKGSLGDAVMWSVGTEGEQ